MRDYELTFIVTPNIEDEGVTGIVERVSQLITTLNGEVISIDVWGRRKLAYAINDHVEGIYVLLKIKLWPASIVEFEPEFKLMEQIIRYLLIKL